MVLLGFGCPDAAQFDYDTDKLPSYGGSQSWWEGFKKRRHNQIKSSRQTLFNSTNSFPLTNLEKQGKSLTRISSPSRKCIMGTSSDQDFFYLKIRILLKICLVHLLCLAFFFWKCKWLLFRLSLKIAHETFTESNTFFSVLIHYHSVVLTDIHICLSISNSYYLIKFPGVYLVPSRC